LPTHTLHELFADHEDTEHGYCAKYHSHLGTHFEKQHSHCEILKTNTPVYNSPDFVILENTEAIFICEINTDYKSGYFNQNYLSVPARGPPAVI